MKHVWRCAIAMCLIGALMHPTAAAAQNADGKASETSGIEKLKINLDLESSSLFDALKLLFSQTKCNFTLDESLKSLTVTAHFTDVPFRIALEALLKATGTPLTYKVENGIYSVIPRIEAPPVKEEPVSAVYTATADAGSIRLIRVYNVSDLDIVQALGGVIVNIGLIPGFGVGGVPTGQNQGAKQGIPGLLDGDQKLFGTGHNQIIVITPPAGAKQ